MLNCHCVRVIFWKRKWEISISNLLRMRGTRVVKSLLRNSSAVAFEKAGNQSVARVRSFSFAFRD